MVANPLPPPSFPSLVTAACSVPIRIIGAAPPPPNPATQCPGRSCAYAQPTPSNQSRCYQATVDGDHGDKSNRVLFESGHTNPVMGVVVTATTAQRCCRRDRSEGRGAWDSRGGEASFGKMAVGDAVPTKVGQTATRNERRVILEPERASNLFLGLFKKQWHRRRGFDERAARAATFAHRARGRRSRRGPWR